MLRVRTLKNIYFIDQILFLFLYVYEYFILPHDQEEKTYVFMD